MTRTNKDFNNKRNQLLEKLWNIFITNGYESTTLSFIIKTLNTSKGSFYHYFSSKEECADAAIEMHTNLWLNEIKEKLPERLNAKDKMKQLILIGIETSSSNNKQYKKINSPSNTIFHEKLIVSITKKFAPLYAEIIIQGISEGVFNVKYPLETAEMILTLSNFYLDKDLFKWDERSAVLKVIAFENILEKIVGADKNTFNFISRIIKMED